MTTLVLQNKPVPYATQADCLNAVLETVAAAENCDPSEVYAVQAEAPKWEGRFFTIVYEFVLGGEAESEFAVAVLGFWDGDLQQTVWGYSQVVRAEEEAA